MGNQALRATGNATSPAVVTMVAAIVNAILDPILIFGLGPFPRLELQGAALASIGSWLLTFTAAGLMLYRHKLLEVIDRSKIMQHWRDLLHVARPAALSNMLNPLANAVLMAMLARIDTKAVAAFGAGTRIEALLLILVTATASALTPFIAQNLGAGQTERARRALMGSIHAIFVIQLLLYIIIFPLAEPIARLFSNDNEVIQYLVFYLHWVPVGYGALGVVILLVLSLNAYQRPGSSLLLNLSRLMLILLPLALLGRYAFGVEGIMLAIPLTNILMAAGCYLLAKQICEPSSHKSHKKSREA